MIGEGYDAPAVGEVWVKKKQRMGAEQGEVLFFHPHGNAQLCVLGAVSGQRTSSRPLLLWH